jgi:hypothetical protein
MTFNTLIYVFAAVGLLLLITALSRFRVMNVGSGAAYGVSATVFLLLAVVAFLLTANLRTYQRLTAEQPGGEIEFSRIAPSQFNGVLTYPDGTAAYFFLRGDEWQIDARILKWRAASNLAGFDTAFKLDRISGRYTHIEDEKTQPRTVYALHPPDTFDVWDLAHRYHSFIPWFDALYGSATFLPMADKATYQISVSQSGLVARPLNQAAKDAVAGWH